METPDEIIAGIKNEIDSIKRTLILGGFTVADLDAHPQSEMAIDWRFWNERLSHWQNATLTAPTHAMEVTA